MYEVPTGCCYTVLNNALVTSVLDIASLILLLAFYGGLTC